MELFNLIPALYGKFIIFMLAFTRISALFATFTMFRAKYINTRIVVALSAIMSAYVVMVNDTVQASYDIYTMSFLIQIVVQFFVGFLAGLILNIIFDVFVAIGQIVSSQIGLSIASLFDPRFGTITSLTHFYVILITLLFLSLNGHLIILKVIFDSFTALPLYQNYVSTGLLKSIFDYSNIIFSGSVLISLTVIVAVLLANIALAVISKFAPQINVFSVGINITMILGLFILYFTFNLYVESGDKLLDEGLRFFEQSMHKLVR